MDKKRLGPEQESLCRREADEFETGMREEKVEEVEGAERLRGKS